MKKILFFIFTIFIIFTIGIFIFKDNVIKNSVQVTSKNIVGAPIKIEKFHMEILKQIISIKGFKMYNPEGFDPQMVMVDIPEITVDYNLGALLLGKIHLRNLILNIKEIVMITKADNTSNVSTIKILQQTEQDTPRKNKKSNSKNKDLKLQIDSMTLTLGQLVQKDIDKNENVTTRATDLGITNKTYKNITSPKQLALIIMQEAFGGSVLKTLGIAGVGTLLGAAVPVIGATAILTAKDSGTTEFTHSVSEVYAIAMNVLNRMGTKVAGDEAEKTIKAKVDGASIAIKIEDNKGKTMITVSARKMLIPMKKIAEGIIYEISTELNTQ